MEAWVQSVRVTDISLDYSLRSAPPIPFDVAYTRTLGHGAIRFLVSEPIDSEFRDGGMVSLKLGHLRYMSLSELRDPRSGRIRTCLVDTNSCHYILARDYMIRLEPEELEDQNLDVLDQRAGVPREELRRRIASLVGVSLAA